MPAAIAGQSHNLHDVRGYDAVDPVRIVELLQIAANPQVVSPSYATTQSHRPKVGFRPSGEIRLHPILDMLNVRYVIFRGNPPPQFHPGVLQSRLLGNEEPAGTAPRFRAGAGRGGRRQRERLTKLAADNFDPRQVAYVEEPVELPAECRGTAEIVDEIPTQVKVSFDMQTPGLVVLADRWDAGWHAYFKGKRVPILQTNHAVRGVVAPAGKGTIEFRYEPQRLRLGLAALCDGLLALVGWAVAARVDITSRPARRKSRRRPFAAAQFAARQAGPATSSPRPVSGPSPRRKKRR